MTRLAELCAGYGGLGLALGIEPAWCAENAPEPAAVMAHRHTNAPNLGDLTELDNPPPADVVAAGFPCQPVSSAGRRKGIDDVRWIIADVCRVARAAGARWLVLENVSGILTANDGDAMARTCEAMAREGFSRWEWGTLRASDVGAPHRRRRWFCVAGAADADGSGRPWPLWDVDPPGRHLSPDDRGRAATDPDSIQPQRRRGPGLVGSPPATEPGQGHQRERPGPPAGHGSPTPTGTDSIGRQRQRLGRLPGHTNPPTRDDVDRRLRPRFGAYAEAVARWEPIVGRRAPDPTIDGRLNPLLVEWMMGLPDGWVTSPDIGLSRRAQLRVLGNGVVPQQAAAAIADLLDRHLTDPQETA